MNDFTEISGIGNDDKDAKNKCPYHPDDRSTFTYAGRIS